MDTSKLVITAEITPNPNTLKFNINRELATGGSMNFPDREKAKGALLPETLFGIDNVLGVMVGRDFVTVTKNPSSGWSDLAEPIIAKLRELVESGKTLLPPQGPADPLKSVAPGAEMGEIERKIREILDNEIRPAVAMDGGDIIFYGYDNGVVTLHLQGSCSSCPSSVLTLKMGVENRLKQLIPEVREVVQV
ncbi:MAG: Fe/S biogenesis protein NfuA [Candidatus Omnitrophica bacterium]|nr:Fe/S biogenesis protein NfuA [Candidatus Omnitrophota bacterium]